MEAIQGIWQSDTHMHTDAYCCLKDVEKWPSPINLPPGSLSVGDARLRAGAITAQYV